MNVNLAQIREEYARLRARLRRLGWISHGYVQDRGPGAGGPCYQWTRKVKAKTVSVALSQGCIKLGSGPASAGIYGSGAL